MATNKTKGRKPNTTPPSPSPKEEASVKVLSLRLPVPLREAAERYADATGLSLNGLLCVSLADYLASRGHQVKG